MIRDLALHSTASTASPLIQQELADDSLHHPNLGGITRGGMANHYPMTLLALLGLGASDAEVLHFKRQWPRSRALIDADLGLQDSQTVVASNWPDYLGQSRYLREFRRVFWEALQQAPTSQVVNQALSVMVNGLPMGLFHPLIRLSFAHSYKDKGQIADALAYMAIRYQDLFLGFEKSPAHIQQAALTEIAPNKTITPQALWQEIAKTFAAANFDLPARRASLSICEAFCGQDLVQEWALGSGFDLSLADLEQQSQAICLLALRLYLYEPALTTLHAVTSAQALAELQHSQGPDLPLAEREIYRQLWRRYWIWLTGLFIEKGHPLHLPEIAPEHLLEIQATAWEDLAIQARQIPEVHLIKMTYSCKWLAEQAGSDRASEAYYKWAVLNMLREQKAHPQQRYGLI